MAATLKYRIIELLSDTDDLVSISDIAKRLKVAYSHAHTFISKLVAEGVVSVKKIGNVSVCRLNFSSPLTLSYLSVLESRKAAEWISKNPQAGKILEKIDLVKDNVHCVLVRGGRIILIVPEKITGVDFSMFRNRSVMNRQHLLSNRHYYNDCIVLHGAEKYWGYIRGDRRG
ncbi:hypothetical protein KY363_05565 [Candidatus Woesearchaeota archaeon]|nr:hypothetical protein [Candidatus Woesearchaeota archaeon]